MRRLVGPDEPTSRAASPSPATRSASDIHASPRKGVEGGDLDEEDTDHERDHHFELRGHAVGQQTDGLGTWTARRRNPSAPASPRCRAPRTTGRRRCRGRRTTCPVPASSSQPAFAAVRLEEPPAEMIDGRPLDVLHEVALQIFRLQRTNIGPEALDRPDPGQVAMSGSGTPARIRNRACSTLGKERSHHSNGTSINRSRIVRCSAHPRPRWRADGTWSGAKRTGRLVEAAVAADAAGDERLHDREVGQELLLGELDLRRAHGCSLPDRPPVTRWYILTRIQTESKLLPEPSDGPPSCTGPHRPSPRPDSGTPPWTTWPPPAE